MTYWIFSRAPFTEGGQALHSLLAFCERHEAFIRAQLGDQFDALAEAVGIRAAARLWGALGGGRLYVPAPGRSRVSPSWEALAAVLGYPVCDAIMQALQGERLELPSGREFLPRLQGMVLLALGCSATEIALIIDCSRTTMNTARSRAYPRGWAEVVRAEAGHVRGLGLVPPTRAEIIAAHWAAHWRAVPMPV